MEGNDLKEEKQTLMDSGGLEHFNRFYNRVNPLQRECSIKKGTNTHSSYSPSSAITKKKKNKGIRYSYKLKAFAILLLL